MSSLYDNLEVPVDASQETIKKAFRRKAMKHHPDRQGDKEAMQNIQQAYDVLGDPERRARYDETGEINQPPPIEPQARQALYGMLNSVIDKLDVDYDDPLIAARQEIRAMITENDKVAEAQKEKIAARQKALKRLVHLEGSVAVREALETAILTLQADLEKQAKAQALCRAVLDLLAEFEYRADERPDQAPTAQVSAADFVGIFASAFRRT